MEKINNTICDICFVVLKKDNTNTKQNKHYNDTCSEHAKYAETFLHEIVSEKLGFKDVSDKNCKACQKELSVNEVNKCLILNSFNLLCHKHIYLYQNYLIGKENE